MSLHDHANKWTGANFWWFLPWHWDKKKRHRRRNLKIMGFFLMIWQESATTSVNCILYSFRHDFKATSHILWNHMMQNCKNYQFFSLASAFEMQSERSELKKKSTFSAFLGPKKKWLMVCSLWNKFFTKSGQQLKEKVWQEEREALLNFFFLRRCENCVPIEL